MRRFLKPHTLLLAGLLAVFSSPSSAQDDGPWVRQSLRSSCEWWENCPRHRKVWRYVRPRHVELRAPRVYGYYHEERSPQCREFVASVGEERYGRDRAKEAAEANWMEAVRARFGTKWMDLRNSRGGHMGMRSLIDRQPRQRKGAGVGGQVPGAMRIEGSAMPVGAGAGQQQGITDRPVIPASMIDAHTAKSSRAGTSSDLRCEVPDSLGASASASGMTGGNLCCWA